ncbi:MAG: YceI family protein [Desulfobacterales bacterium]
MKFQRILKIIMFIIVLGMLAILSSLAQAAETYKLDPMHTSIVFRVKHLGVAYVYGRFNGPSGTFVFDETSPSKSAIEMQAETNNIDTAVEKRDTHLKSPDFFNTGEYPTVSFKSKSVKKLNEAVYEVSGDLTLLGKTRPITVEVNATGAGKDPWGNFRRGFETSFSIKRSDFGMTFMLGGVSDEVNLTVSVEGIRQ